MPANTNLRIRVTYELGPEAARTAAVRAGAEESDESTVQGIIVRSRHRVSYPNGYFSRHGVELQVQGYRVVAIEAYDAYGDGVRR